MCIFGKTMNFYAVFFPCNFVIDFDSLGVCYCKIKTISLIQFEEAAKEVADEVTKPRPLGEEEVQDIQITLKSETNPMGVRDLKVCKNMHIFVNRFKIIDTMC